MGAGTAAAQPADWAAALVWSDHFQPQPDVDLPRAGPDAGPAGISTLSANQRAILDYVLANTAPDSYLFATLDSHGASAFILAQDAGIHLRRLRGQRQRD